MKVAAQAFRSYAARFTAVGIICALYLLARQPELSTAERVRLASGFAFRSFTLPELPGRPQQAIRTVNPSLRGIAGWVSATGAAVALNDLDGDGQPNDLCLVDPRTDLVMVAPVPGGQARYEPFPLDAGDYYRRATMAPMGCLPADFNEDGLTDVLVYYWGRTPLVFLAKDRSPHTAARLSPGAYSPAEVLAGGDRWYTGAATLADLDGDGHADLVFGNYYADGARILDGGASVGDSMQHSMTRAFNAGRSRLLRWVGAASGQAPSVRYEVVEDYVEGSSEVKEQTTHGWTLAVAAADLDGDLLPEIYFANDFGPDRLLHNRSTPGVFRFVPVEGVKGLTTPTSKVLGRDGFKGMGVDVGDINGDGLPDIYVSNIAEAYALEESHFAFINNGRKGLFKDGVAPFTDESERLGLSRSGWSWEAKLGDFNNDGRLEALQATGFIKGEANCWPELHELAMGNDQLLEKPGVWPRLDRRCALSDRGHNPFFVMAGDGGYYDLAEALGLDGPHISRGIATADVDGDGRLDYAVANQWEPSYFYHNEGAGAGAFLGLHLRLPLDGGEAGPTEVYDGHPRVGTRSLAAVGAHASVRLPDGRRLVSEVDGGNGHSGKRSPDIHFGLGALASETTLPVEISWRDRGGKVHELSLRVRPGWHTVVLRGTEWRSGDGE
jgi:hypothetical protein